MVEIVNLRRARKQRDRDVKEAKASENRARFGRSTRQAKIEEANRGQAERRLDGHRRENGGDADT